MKFTEEEALRRHQRQALLAIIDRANEALTAGDEPAALGWISGRSVGAIGHVVSEEELEE